MERADGASTRARQPSAEAADLVQIAKRALEAQSVEKQRAHVDHAEVPQQAWLNAPGDTLDLSKQGATALPVEVIELIKDRVERLALSHNNQIFLPENLSLCSRLFYLNLRWNNFTSFPESVLLLTNLQTLDLSRNNLTSIPDDINRMTSLKFLAFTNNQVTRLPLCMGEMTSLTRLKMDDNLIEYPSPEEFTPSPEARNRHGFESNTYVCGQVKRFMRREKERYRQETESEMSESNLETPRPLRRTNTGRFPVRPSMGSSSSHDTHQSIGSVGSANGDGRMMAEPPRFYHHAPAMAPHRPMAKDSLAIPPVRRPGLAPLAIQGYSNRSRSETIATGGQKLKRHGFVPSRKTSGPPSANSLNTRDHQSIKPTHLRTASYAPGLDDEEEVRANSMSPPDQSSRQPWVSRSRLSSLPEDRRVSKITNPTIRSARLLVYTLDQLNRPMDDVIRIIRSESPRPSTAERLHINATQNLKELDAQLHILTPLTEQQSPESKEIRQILRRSRYCVQAYHQVVSQLRLNARKLVLRGDPVYLRSLMLQIHASLLEVRNACAIQETTLVPPASGRYSNISQARSDRTVTPTQAKPSSKRARGAKIMATMRRESPMSATYSSGLLSSASSRTTTMTSMSLATPRSGDSFNPMVVSGNNGVTSTPLDSEEIWQFEKIYLSLKQVCDLADQTLISCRQDLFVRKEGAARNMSSTAARAWNLALNKCDSLMHAFDLLKEKLGRVRLNDPSNRKSRDFWVVCDGVFNAWYDLASEMKVLGSQGLDIGSVKPLLRPLQKAIKEASHVVNTSSVVRRAFDARSGAGNGSFHHQNMPPTPLSAALGPAAQATIPNTPGLGSGVTSPADHWYNYRYDTKERERERSDTVTSRYGNGYRGR
ncbi:hypothetical protein K461DRAFT_280608 [Myriangium duriaei CBS 260.36]|uniref:Disease resistance R13L4/SHOC-2-like LRR domain-containing protein n=1 Tax=Myriangium duriaei CBS 260.36 TaxID=1168546 RepID=A0A9P4MF28_9PEZI|nr:hypothetical protein K461DRAFT_280608 [Myriangium duriaei CBS 260.36]